MHKVKISRLQLLLYTIRNTLYWYPYWLHITCLCRFAAQCISPPLWCWDYKRDHIYWLVEKRDRRHWSWSGLTVSKRFLWLVGKCWPWIRQWKWNLKSIILKAPNIVKVYIKIYYWFASGNVVCIKSFAIIIIMYFFAVLINSCQCLCGLFVIYYWERNYVVKRIV